MRLIWDKQTLRVIGLMSGTSADGMDAALTEITGYGVDTRVRMLGFVSLPYPDPVRESILRLACGTAGGSREMCLFSALMGQLSVEACLAVCESAGISPETVDLVGSHGQTLWHNPAREEYAGYMLRGTLQAGDPSLISERLGCPVVSDFRVRDMAAGGQGAPLVPYAEYLLYRRTDRSVGLQNIGGIGNLTVLPKGGAPEDTFAFDTGPGNMVMDQLMERRTQGRERCDRDGAVAAAGRCGEKLLAFLMADPYLKKSRPKSTGREAYGKEYVDRLIGEADRLGMAFEDVMATVCRFTAECVRVAIEWHCPVRPDCLVVGGGGSRNPTLMKYLKDLLPIPVMQNEDLGFDGDAKEAVAFAILANECVHQSPNNMPSVTGARHPVVMGKVSF